MHACADAVGKLSAPYSEWVVHEPGVRLTVRNPERNHCFLNDMVCLISDRLDERLDAKDADA